MKASKVSALVFGVLGLVLCLSAHDASTAKKLLESKSKRALEVAEFSPLGSSGLFLLIVQDRTNGYKTLLISDTKQQNLMVASAFFSSDESVMKRVSKELNTTNAHNFKVRNSAKLNTLFASLPKDYAITIAGASPKKLYIVSDPMCSHCQEELARIEEKLQTHTIIMIPVGLLGQDSLYKAADIARQIRSAKTPKEQIQVLRKIYARTYEPTTTSGDSAYSTTLRVTSSIRDSGLIDSVPFIYEALN